MKSLFKILGILGLAITVTSCTSGTGVYTNVRVYRAPDGRIYRHGDIYRMPNGDVYQNGILIRRGAPTVIVVNEPLPPGQAKKIYVRKSARDFAPGNSYNKKYYKKSKKHHDDDDD